MTRGPCDICGKNRRLSDGRCSPCWTAYWTGGKATYLASDPVRWLEAEGAVAAPDSSAAVLAGRFKVAERTIVRWRGKVRRPFGVTSHGNTLHSGAARIQLKSANRKLSPVDLVDVGGERPRPIPRGPFCCSTYASIEATCSSDCPFKGHGCYVQAGFTGRAVRQLDKLATGRNGLDVARDEANAIDAAFPRGVPQDGARGGRDLRLHDSGDASAPPSAALLGAAATRWRKRGGGAVWTYTHAWRSVERKIWGKAVSVLASVERAEDIPLARAQGYAPALVVEQHDDGQAYDVQGTRIIPCPAETKGTTCVECRLCLDRDLVRMNAGIAFAAHGSAVSSVLTALRVAAAPRAA